MRSMNFYGRRWQNTHYDTNPISFDPLCVEIIGAESQNPFCSIDSVAEGLMSSPSAHALEETKKMLEELELKDHAVEATDHEDDDSTDATDHEDDDNACWGRYSPGGPLIKFPPPITLLKGTRHLQGSVPYVHQRTYTEDGRLQIKQFKVKHPECLKAHRADGKLTVKLVHSDDSASSSCKRPEEEEQESVKEEEQEKSGTLQESCFQKEQETSEPPPETSYAAGMNAIGCYSPEEGVSPVHPVRAAILRAVKS